MIENLAQTLSAVNKSRRAGHPSINEEKWIKAEYNSSQKLFSARWGRANPMNTY